MTDVVLNINKPQGFTSHDVVAKLRGILKIKRIGHCGTLDPMATGVLPVCVGRATKAAEFIAGQDKEYIASFKLGLISDTLDITGNVTAVEHESVDPEGVKRMLESFTGEIYQTPPMYSAIKIDGVKLYKLARAGKDIKREKRKIVINYINLLSYDQKNEEYTIRVGCSKGTYVRSLCHDIGQALNCGAVLTKLERTKTGMFSIDDTLTFEDIQNGRIEKGVYSLEEIFEALPKIVVDNKTEALIKNGVQISLDSLGKTDEGVTYAVFGSDCLLMLARPQGNVLKMIKSFY